MNGTEMHEFLTGRKFARCRVNAAFVEGSMHKPEKSADIWRTHNWFLREMTSEKRAQKFHTHSMGSASDSGLS